MPQNNCPCTQGFNTMKLQSNHEGPNGVEILE